MSGVSVIVPVYNSEKFLKVCLTSLVNQTLKDLEIIIINDHTNDDSEKIIKYFMKNYNNIKYISLKSNKGLGYVRNLGIKKSTKKYIGFVDSDDYVDLDMFEKMYNMIENTASDVCECNFIWEYPNKEILDRIEPYEVDRETLTYVRVLAPNKIYKKEVLIDNNILFAEGLKYEDILFTSSLIPFIKKICFTPKPFYHYVQRSNSLVNSQTIRVREVYEVLNQVIEFYKRNNLYENYKNELEYIYVRYILLSSFKRACKIKNKEDKKSVLDEGYDLILDKYPNYKNNLYFKKKGIKNFYMRHTNKFIYKMLSNIL